MEHMEYLSEKIVAYDGEPTTQPAAIYTAKTVADMLKILNMKKSVRETSHLFYCLFYHFQGLSPVFSEFNFIIKFRDSRL